ncbi:MFS transporter [Streptomyces huiliensis]|uniref:MFS transporter n=1 Tax=Streptomyces huiliensis TaxID=2876027 RepID=UPI001CBB12E1|nr:MFS transporter [Streptomyces huiliensis]MBZ4318153.1 MFS transporter [Streptomyces huiliensis]
MSTIPSPRTTSVPGPSEAGPTDNGPGPGRSGRSARPGWLLLIVLVGQFMAILDSFVVNVATATIRSELHASGSGLQLIVAGYTISYAVLLITGARLGARHGHRRVFLAGLALFTLASLLCGLADGAGGLIAFRFVQGAGAAVMLPQVLSLIQRTYDGPARARALGLFSAVIASGAAIGMIVGGLLIDADLFGWTWRPVFLVNVPIGLLLLLLGIRLMPRDEPRAGERARGLDLPGLVLLAAAVMCFTVPMVLGEEQDWPLWTWLSFALCALLAAVFAGYEARLARRGGAPLIAPVVLRAPGVPRAVARLGLTMAMNAGVLLSLSLHLQSGLGFGPLRTGLTFLPTAVAFGAVGLNWRRLPERWHGALPTVGLLLAAVSFAGTGLVLRDGGDGGAGGLWLYAVLLGGGGGLGLAFSPTLGRTLAGVRPEHAADASGLLTTTSQLGLLTGVAVYGAVYLAEAGGGAGASSAHGVWITSLALAGTAVAAVGTAFPHRGR